MRPMISFERSPDGTEDIVHVDLPCLQIEVHIDKGDGAHEEYILFRIVDGVITETNLTIDERIKASREQWIHVISVEKPL